MGLLFALGCDDEPDGTDLECSLELEAVIGEASSPVDALATIRATSGSHVFWSDPWGTHRRWIPDAATEIAEATPARVGPRCDGGLAVTEHRGHVVVACLRRAVPAAGKDGGVAVLRLVEETLQPAAHFGTAGSRSDGVSVAADGEAIHVAWHDSRSSSVELVSVVDGEPSVARTLSRQGTDAGRPHLKVINEQLHGTWTEVVYDQEANAIGEVVVWTQARGAQRIAPVLFPLAQPQLGSDGDRMVVAFRDENPSGTKARLFVQRIDNNLSATQDLVRVGRADGPGAPVVGHCDDGWYAVAPRSYSTYDVLIGINRFDEQWTRHRGERQLYEANKRYTLAAAECRPDGMWVFAAEQAALNEPARIHASALRCQ